MTCLLNTSFINSLQKQELEHKKDEEARKKKEEEEKKKEDEENQREQQKREEERKKRDEERKKKEEEEIRQVVQQEADEQIQKIKVKLIETEGALKSEREKAKENDGIIEGYKQKIEKLKKLLEAEREKNSKLEKALREREVEAKGFIEERDQLLKDKNDLYQKLEKMFQGHARELSELTENEISSVLGSIVESINNLNNPKNFGNPNATPEDIAEAAKLLGEQTKHIGEAVSSGNRVELMQGLKFLSANIKNLFDDVKGAARGIENDEVRSQLLTSSTETARAFQGLLSLTKSMGGNAKSDQQKKQLAEALTPIHTELENIAKAAMNSEKVEDVEGFSLDELAERELLAAAKEIENATRSLSEHRPKPKENWTEGIADSLLQAVTAIGKACNTLVMAAAKSQKERVEKGRSLPPSHPYHKNGQW